MAIRSSQIKENARVRGERAPEFAKQVAERGRKKADGGVHAIDRKAHVSQTKNAADSKEVVLPAKRRYQRPSALPAIPALPGYHMEYVRRDQRHRGDHANMSAHLRSGWEFVRASEISDKYLPTTSLSGHGDCIGNDDTVLMKIDDELWADRNAQIEDKRDATTQAINQKTPMLDVSHPALPLTDLENTSRASFRQVAVKGGRRPSSVAED